MAIKVSPRRAVNRIKHKTPDTSDHVVRIRHADPTCEFALFRVLGDASVDLTDCPLDVDLLDYLARDQLFSPWMARVNPIDSASQRCTALPWVRTEIGPYQLTHTPDHTFDWITLSGPADSDLFGVRAAFIAGTGGAFELRQPLELLYDALGSRATPSLDRDALFAAWRSEGVTGAAWLCQRLREETDVERQTDAEEALIAIGHAGLPEILGALLAAPSSIQAEALLHALRWIGVTPDLLVQARRVLQVAAQNKSGDVRLAAAKAAQALPERDALRIWRDLLRDEDDPDVREGLNDLLQQARS